MDVCPGDLTFGLEKNLISHMMLGSIRASQFLNLLNATGLTNEFNKCNVFIFFWGSSICKADSGIVESCGEPAAICVLDGLKLLN